jgi:hypothetical protein
MRGTTAKVVAKNMTKFHVLTSQDVLSEELEASAVAWRSFIEV